jgi:hypothetical protein
MISPREPEEITMIDFLAFALVAFALATPQLINLVWDATDLDQAA